MERTQFDHGQQQGPAMPVHGALDLSHFVEKARLEIIVDADSVEKLYAVKSALQQMGVEEFMESTLLWHGRRKGRAASYRGVPYATNFVERVKLEMLVPIDSVENLVAAIGNIAKTAELGDWRLCFTPQVFPVDVTASPRS